MNSVSFFKIKLNLTLSRVGEFHRISYSFLSFSLLPQGWSPPCLGIHAKEEKGCVQAHLYTALTMGDPWSLPPREEGFAVMVQAHSWQSEKAPASPIWLLHPGISHLLRQSRAKLAQTETFIPPLEPEELKQQESRSSSSHVPRVLRVKCGLGQGTGGCRWWQGPSSDLAAKGVCLDPPSPRQERDFADIPVETQHVFLQV